MTKRELVEFALSQPENAKFCTRPVPQGMNRGDPDRRELCAVIGNEVVDSIAVRSLDFGYPVESNTPADEETS